MTDDMATRAAIAEGRTALGIELGSTRIKAVLIGPDHAPIAVGSHDWENQFVDRLLDLLPGRGLGRAPAVLRRPGRRRPAAVRRRADHGRRARRLGHDARLSRLRRRRRAADPVPDLAQHQHRRGRRAAERGVRPQHPAPVERRPPVPGDPERRGSRRPDRAPDHAGRLRPLAAHRASRCSASATPAACSRSTSPPAATTPRCWPSSTSWSPRPASTLTAGRPAAHDPARRGAGRRAHRRRAPKLLDPTGRLQAGRPDVPARGRRRDRHGGHQLGRPAHRQRQRRHQHLRHGRARAASSAGCTASSTWSPPRPATWWRWCTATTAPAS